MTTGAAGGIGTATATLLTREGATVVLTDTDEAGGKALADEIVVGGGTAEFHVASGEASYLTGGEFVIDGGASTTLAV